MHGRFFCLLLLLGAAGCSSGRARPTPTLSPAPEKPRIESDLARITLTEEAARSLKIRTSSPRSGPIQDQLLLPGWVMVPPGNEVAITAPVAGYVLAGEGPIPGHPVKENAVLFRLRPVLSPLEQIQLATLKRGVESELTKARESVALAEKEFERTTELHEKKLRGQQDLEQASTRLRHAREDLQSARDKLDLFGKAAEKSTLPPLNLTAPRSATVLSVHVSPGQYVSAAAPLVTLADLSELWLRVPVPEADLLRLDRKAPARILLRPEPGKDSVPLTASLKTVVPTVDPTRRTADVIYELPPAARERGLQARDQMVQVRVPVDSRSNESLVPCDAVVYDAHAGAWLYLERTTSQDKGRVYERRRVELGPLDGKLVAVRRRTERGTEPACKPEDRVVVEGAALLFSREFYKP
jgi:RND family efflux transporter MFP subunit